ncbi:MAG: heme o synthase [Actinomycetota bacterium]
MSRFQKLSLATTALTAVLIGVGGLVRASGSGLGCPDWPLCHGAAVPPAGNVEAMIEYSHRITASIVGAFVLATAIYAWLRFRRVASIFWPAFLALVVVIFQAGLGAVVVRQELEAQTVALHFGTALVLVLLTTLTSVAAFHPRGGRADGLARAAIATAAVTFLALILGAVVVQSGASFAYTDWPLMDRGVLPGETLIQRMHHAHRVGALLAGIALGVMAVRVMKRTPRDRTLVRLAHAAFAMWLVQALIGGTVVLTGVQPWTVVAHVTSAGLVWIFTVALAATAWRKAPTAEPAGAPEPVAAKGSGGGRFPRTKAYFLLTKPRIIELLLITTVPAMVVAERGWPSSWLVLMTLLGGSLTAGSANSINCFLDRDIDEKMQRTSNRPLPAHRVEPANALVFGIVLGILGFVQLTLTVNLAAACLAVSAILFYVFVYTMWMKRSTPSNIVIGGAAGAVPVLVGWAAVTGEVGLPALVLFAIVFYWTPPHFWALALRYSSDYAAAGVPMLPVVRGVTETTRQMLLYSVALFAVSLLLYPAAALGTLYLVAVLALSAIFTAGAWHLHRNPDPGRAMKLFHVSISYLTLLFVLMAVDVLIGSPRIAGLDGPAYVVAASAFFGVQAVLLASLVRRSRARPGREDGLPAEVAWTALPTLVVVFLFLGAWKALTGI